MAFFRTLLHGGAHLFRQKTRHESIACLLTDFLGKIKFTLNQTTFLPFRKTAYPRVAPSAGARGNYKAHISKYVRHILKYLRHIFCRPGNPPGKSPGNADKNGGRLLAPPLPARPAAAAGKRIPHPPEGCGIPENMYEEVFT